jgi:glutamate racemase
MGPDVVLVSSAEETAFEVRACLGVPPHAPPSPTRRVSFVTSGDVDVFGRLGARFLGPEVEHVEAWSWS